MSLISMATSGLSGFISNVSNTITQQVSSTVNGYKNAVSNVFGAVNDVKNTVSGIAGLFSGSSGSGILSNSGYNKSTAGNFKAGGNARENSIYDYLSNFKHGVMKPNRFRAEFNLPKGVSGSSTSFANASVLTSRIKTNEQKLNGKGSINVKCHQATFPARSLDTMLFKCNSANFRIPYSATYDPITLTFYADGYMDSREYFELWQSCALNFGNNTSNFYNEYVSDVKLYMQDEFGADTYGIILYEAYPMSVSMFDASYAAQNSPLSIQVILGYKSWIPMSNSNSSAFNRTI